MQGPDTLLPLRNGYAWNRHPATLTTLWRYAVSDHFFSILNQLVRGSRFSSFSCVWVLANMHALDRKSQANSRSGLPPSVQDSIVSTTVLPVLSTYSGFRRACGHYVGNKWQLDIQTAVLYALSSSRKDATTIPSASSFVLPLLSTSVSVLRSPTPRRDFVGRVSHKIACPAFRATWEEHIMTRCRLPFT